MIENQEVGLERSHEDEDGNDDQAEDACTPMFCLLFLRMCSVPWVESWNAIRTTVNRVSPNLSHRSSTVYTPTSAVTKRPIILTLWNG